jgi:hypothetical protein
MKSEKDQTTWVESIFFRLTSRAPNIAELEDLQQLFETELQNYEADKGAAEALVSIGTAARSQQLSLSDLAALTLVTNVILNLDEAKMKS